MPLAWRVKGGSNCNELEDEVERLRKENERLFEQANQCAIQQLNGGTVADNIGEITGMLGSFASIATGATLAALGALFGATGTLFWCGATIPIPLAATGDEDEWVIQPIEIDGVVTSPNINATIRKQTNVITDVATAHHKSQMELTQRILDSSDRAVDAILSIFDLLNPVPAATTSISLACAESLRLQQIGLDYAATAESVRRTQLGAIAGVFGQGTIQVAQNSISNVLLKRIKDKIDTQDEWP